MRAKISFAGINSQKDAEQLAEMIRKARRRTPREQTSGEKKVFVEIMERKEAEFLAQGFDRA
ncbi:MAG: hypothetical protein A2V65_07175 [Deltaproteobacteria bacterium RBG_13_49_15]|nr:MAG: hypothetical protein A2V65_07175 [Deltaproteobacteria bacterium RBG_13_49_15]